MGAQDKPTPPMTKKSKLAYRTLPLIYDPIIADSVYKQSMETLIMITQHKLLSLSLEVRLQYRDSTTTWWIPNKDILTTQALLQQETETDNEAEVTLPIFLTFSLPKVTYSPGSVTVSNSVEAYYQLLFPGYNLVKKALTVSLESSAIQSILAFVDNNQRMECILYPGCQVITMSAICCHELELPYNPTIRLNMQSANETCNLLLGLAHNVSFLIDTITFYLQVHIIQLPAYDVFLGQPFDILTESIVHNFANEDQTITICNPNTSHTLTIPIILQSGNGITKFYVPKQPNF